MKRHGVHAAGLLMLLLLFAPLKAQALIFTVDAYLNSGSGGTGLGTGIYFSAGDYFTVTADPDDLWSAGELPRWSNADGLIGPLYATGSDESGQPAGTLIGADFGTWCQYGLCAPFGSLVGELGGAYFLLGSGFSGAAPADGMLSLYYWDSNNSDNSGSITVDVSNGTSPLPEPSTLLLLGSGLAGLVGFRKRLKSKIS